MPNLFDTIQQNRQQLAGQQAPVTDETSRIQQLLRAKSGKQVTSSEGGISNIGEQAAVDSTNQQLASLQPQLAVQQQAEQTQRAGQAQQGRIAEQEISQSKRFNTIENNLKTQQLLNDLSRDRGSLDLDRKQAAMEQAAFLLSMQDKQYTDTLEAVGRQRRLDNDAAFRNEMQDMAFQDTIGLVKQRLGQSDILAVNDREFEKAMSAMSLEDAMRIAELEAKYTNQASDINADLARSSVSQQARALNQQSKWQGINDITQTGIEGYGKIQNRQDRATEATPKLAPASKGGR